MLLHINTKSQHAVTLPAGPSIVISLHPDGRWSLMSSTGDRIDATCFPRDRADAERAVMRLMDEAIENLRRAGAPSPAQSPYRA